VSDWETEGVMVGRPDQKVIERETKNDFDEIDTW